MVALKCLNHEYQLRLMFVYLKYYIFDLLLVIKIINFKNLFTDTSFDEAYLEAQ